MKPTVYIETTIPSYYFDEREALAVQCARTREWWDKERAGYECFTSPEVMAELDDGDYPHQQDCLALVQNVPMLGGNPQITRIADVYWAEQLMPLPPCSDAIHLAFASYYRIDFLLTWNIRHLANVRKEQHLCAVNNRLRLHVPRLVTPELLRPLEDET
jgi:hypothetical protein